MAQVGDRVRFLNTVGGGVIKSINKGIALVEEEDGFETPVLLHECVVITEAPAKPKAVQPEVYSPKRAQEQAKVAPKPIIRETKEGEALSLFVGFVPAEGRNGFDAYLINESNYFLFVSLLCQEGALCRTLFAGTLEPNTKRRVERIEKEEVSRWENLTVQYLCYKQEKSFELKPTASVRLKIDSVKFYKLHTFKENDFFEQEALLFPVVLKDQTEKPVTVSAEALAIAMREKARSDAPRSIQTSATSAPAKSEPLVVDLHAHELLETTAGMSNGEILSYQLDQFHEIMRQYRGKKGMRIVFIHGKGNGVLRKALLTELQRKYGNCSAQDASFREYGFGATLVTIR